MVEINAEDWSTQRCKACDFTQPLRSSHCRICERCVGLYDHHCETLNTCIGERNHLRFYIFILLELCTLLYGLIMVSKHLYTSKCNYYNNERSTYTTLHNLSFPL